MGIGRTSRTIPRRLRRLVEHRDGGCAVPGCGRTWGTQLHHIWHWEDGGPTDLSNLLTLCARHHRQHHLGLLGITGCPDRALGTDPLSADSDDGGVNDGMELGRGSDPLDASDDDYPIAYVKGGCACTTDGAEPSSMAWLLALAPLALIRRKTR